MGKDIWEGEGKRVAGQDLARSWCSWGGFWQAQAVAVMQVCLASGLQGAGMLPVHIPGHLPLLSTPPCFGPRDGGWWEHRGAPLAAPIPDSHIHPRGIEAGGGRNTFSLLPCPRWGEGAGGRSESKPPTEAKQTKQLITGSPRKFLGLGAGGEGCNSSASLAGSSA